jgi:hypothetical protein
MDDTVGNTDHTFRSEGEGAEHYSGYDTLVGIVELQVTKSVTLNFF